MGRRRKSVKFDFVQVPEEFRQSRCAALAALLAQSTRTRVDRAEALALAVDLWAWHLQQVDENAPDLSAAFRSASFIPLGEAETRMHLATGWPKKTAMALLEALSHPMVRVLAFEDKPQGWRVVELQQRYLAMATKQQGSRARSRLNVLAHENGWVPEEGQRGTWTNSATGEAGVHWKALLARLEGGK